MFVVNIKHICLYLELTICVAKSCILTCICLRQTLCAHFSCERRTVTSSHLQLICLSCITWHWKKLLDEQWSRSLDYERWYLYRCSLYAPCGIIADYEFRFVLQLSQTVAQYNSTTAFCNLWWHSCTVIFVGNIIIKYINKCDQLK